MKTGFLPLLALLFLLSFPGTVEARDLGEILRGPAFFPADQTTSKPEEWLQAPIDYGKWAQGADVALTLDQTSLSGLFADHSTICP